MAKQVDFEVRVIDADKAAQEFNKVDDKIEDIKNQSSQTIPKVNDLGSSISSTATMARNATQGITALAGIIGGAALIGGLTIAIAAFLDWKKQLDELNKRLGEFEAAANKAIGAMLKFKDPIKIRFELDTTDTKNLLALAETRKKILEEENKAIWRSNLGAGRGSYMGVDIGQMTADIAMSLGLWSSLTEEQQKQLKYNEGLIKAMEEQLYTLEAQDMLAKDMKNLGKEAVDIEKDKTKEIKKQMDMITGGQAGIYEAIASRKGVKSSMAGIGIGGIGKLRADVTREQEEYEEMLKDRFEFMNDLAISSANVLRNEFMIAWEDIFGKANSLFGKLIANIADQLAGLATQSIASGIFGFILNMFAPGSGAAAAAMGKQTIQVNIGDKKFAEMVVQGNKTANKLRLQ